MPKDFPSSTVFISYSKKDKVVVSQFISRFQNAGIKVWIDQAGIGGASIWAEEIVKAIKHCSVFVLFLSKSSVVSKNVQKELSLAAEADKIILPVKLDPVEIPDGMRYHLTNIHFIETYEMPEAEITKTVVQALKKLRKENDLPASDISETEIESQDTTIAEPAPDENEKAKDLASNKESFDEIGRNQKKSNNDPSSQESLSQNEKLTQQSLDIKESQKTSVLKPACPRCYGIIKDGYCSSCGWIDLGDLFFRMEITAMLIGIAMIVFFDMVDDDAHTGVLLFLQGPIAIIFGITGTVGFFIAFHELYSALFYQSPTMPGKKDRGNSKVAKLCPRCKQDMGNDGVYCIYCRWIDWSEIGGAFSVAWFCSLIAIFAVPLIPSIFWQSLAWLVLSGGGCYLFNRLITTSYAIYCSFIVKRQ